MWLLNKIKPTFVLRLGLGAMYAYSGWHIVTDPASWVWAVQSLPAWAQAYVEKIGVNNFLLGQGIIELVFAFTLLAWFMPRKIVAWVGFLSGLQMILIVWLVGLDDVTFRDFGLAGASLAVWLSSLRPGE